MATRTRSCAILGFVLGSVLGVPMVTAFALMKLATAAPQSRACVAGSSSAGLSLPAVLQSEDQVISCLCHAR